MTADIITLEAGKQRLRLIPSLGGSVAAWDWKAGDAWAPLFRPWDGQSEERYSFACFPLVPWSNRITGGGFEHDGVFHPVKLNKPGEAYPIHGDGWMQPWQVQDQGDGAITLALESHRFDGDPYDYRSTQRFILEPHALRIELSVTHHGEKPLPYGLGLHPYFVRNERTLLQSPCDGVWLAGDDPIPVSHTTEFPPTWDYNQPAPLQGPLIDNCFTGWIGESVISYPDRGISITMTMDDCNGYSLMYRPPDLPFFCLEPITQPIDAFHMPGQPGLAILNEGDTFVLKSRFAVSALG
ncbi:aldose 1-epimerase [Noviherbaspirillum humi]|uniref:Aldose 1-epimerase n=1 Tax=Noviherbaspirillum humi TaxID=1688639 RepID=A0A239H8H6_9BURK|nr:aldose 1-epimerase [Noviherbaspirillum humi]SNS77677.1 aldose 1-epimerase [Noviherbaspirillum humi]